MLVGLFIAGLTTISQPVFALSTQGIKQVAAPPNCNKPLFGIPTWYEYLPVDANCKIDTTGMGGDVVVLVVMALIDILLVLAGLLAVGFIIFGGFKYITSQAEPTKLAGARTTILNAVIGLVIAIIASNVITFIATRLVDTTKIP
jgi:hypothetical protein